MTSVDLVLLWDPQTQETTPRSKLVPFVYPHPTQTSDQLSILEIYKASGQGEGFYAGVPSIFVRTNYCPVGCHFCDTKYSWNNKSARIMSVPDVLAEIIEQGDYIRHVVFTGGEPFSQPLPAVFDLLQTLTKRGYIITVETSGIVNPQFINRHLPWRDLNLLYSISPKLSSAKTNFEFPDLLSFITSIRAFESNQKVQLKFVIDPFTDDYDEVKMRCRDLLSLPQMFLKNLWIILQPVTLGQPNINLLRDQVLTYQEMLQEMLSGDRFWAPLQRSGVTVCVRPQSHALLFGNRRLV